MKQWHEKWILDAALSLYTSKVFGGVPREKRFEVSVVTSFKLFQECCNGFDRMERGEMGEVHGIYTGQEEKEDEQG